MATANLTPRLPTAHRRHSPHHHHPGTPAPRYKQVQAGTLQGLSNPTQTAMALSPNRLLTKSQEDWAARVAAGNGGTVARSPKWQASTRASQPPPQDCVAPIAGVPAAWGPSDVLRVYLKRQDFCRHPLEALAATDARCFCCSCCIPPENGFSWRWSLSCSCS